MRTSSAARGSAITSECVSSTLVTWSAIRSLAAIITDKSESASANCPVDASVRWAEHPGEDRVHVRQVVVEVEQLREIVGRDLRGDFGIGLEQIEQRQLPIRFPHLHRIALDQGISILAAQARPS